MKQAILVTAYKDATSLIELINIFGENFNFYIHVDAKSKINIKAFNDYKNVFISKKYKVNWGGFNNLRAILFLSKEALRNSENSFFHLITGEDFPIKSIREFLGIDQSKNYLDYFKIPQTPSDVWLDRLKFYHLYDFLNAKNEKQKYYLDILVRLQRKYKIERKYPIDLPQKIFAGSTYWSLNRNALEYVVSYPNKRYLKRFKFTFCSEEFYFQTLLLNSKFQSTIVNKNLRYIDWESGRGGYPAFLDATDFDYLISENEYFFARKISRNELRQKLTENILSN